MPLFLQGLVLGMDGHGTVTISRFTLHMLESFHLLAV